MSSKRQSSKTGRKEGWNGPLTTVYEGATLKQYSGFTITPGQMCGRSGLIARRDRIVEMFPFNAKPDQIKARLDELVSDLTSPVDAVTEDHQVYIKGYIKAEEVKTTLGPLQIAEAVYWYDRIRELDPSCRVGIEPVEV